MNQHRFTGSRKEFRGKTGKNRGKPTVDPLDAADQLADSVREPYGISNEEAARQLDGFLDRNRDWDPSNG